MKQENKSVHGVWGSRWVFILAATGSAVGLGNIWRFPYITGENGGGAFVLLYLLCIAVVGIPIMAAEVMLGRKGGLSPINTMRKLAGESKVTQRWAGIGIMGALSAFLILSFYSAVASWALYYTWEAARGVFEGITATQSEAHFDSMLADPWLMLGFHSLFMLLTMVVVARGVKGGLEKAVQVLMPLLFVLLLVLVGYAATTPGFSEGMNFLFAFDFSKLTGKAVLVAVGQAFFTLSLGMGAIMTYGAYMPREVTDPKTGKKKPVSILSTVAIIAVLDTLVALGAGMAMFPLLFSGGLEVGQGPGMMFVTLPLAFGSIPGGVLFGTLFFLLVVCAAWSSSISLGEPVVAWLVEKGLTRAKAAIVVGLGAWLLGVGSVLSFNVWKDNTFLAGTFFDNMEFLSTTVMLPLGGLLIAIFAGWVMKETHARKELGIKNFKLYLVWRALVRIFSPAAVVALFVYSIWSVVAPADEAAPVQEPEPVAPAASEAPGVAAGAEIPAPVAEPADDAEDGEVPSAPLEPAQ
ncbi:sodium-dependent transporter [Alcanivorax sp.]|uniref:sodium-dependent transporter n=1 Tax=Alcanivorax sp. TaxID=1872427 RepID=UPI002B273A14|nr:sodium-dependent transporter [Alcanivorax sp.]